MRGSVGKSKSDSEWFSDMMLWAGALEVVKKLHAQVKAFNTRGL